MEFIDLKTQYLQYQSEIDARIAAVLSHGKFIMGPEVHELEAKLASYVGVQHCITVASGTDSLEIALRALEIGPGDEVITVPFTWISSAEVILLVGAKPVFVDIEPECFNIDLNQIEAAITSRTKAIIPVSLFGQMPDYSAINQIASKYGVTVIEDAAQSFGATQNGRRSCGATEIASTSFFPSKPLGCFGDGGALFTDNKALAEKMAAIRTHGGVVRHHHPYVGMNGRMDTIQAAVVLAKLPHFPWETLRREEIGNRYTKLIGQSCRTPKVRVGNSHVYAQYTIRHQNRDLLSQALKDKGVPTAVYYPKCIHEQPVFARFGYHRGLFPQSESAADEVLSLPMHPFLYETTQDQIANILITACCELSRASRA
jgi:UDP-2-acetamido-2-deoxy-ribo-hexuluronate aminotransferase